jgi:eukaryotic-like serine/threonine-protein kinase
MTETCARCGARYSSGRFAACPRCLLDAPVEPALLGDHLELEDEIGSGGMGTVYRAQDRRLGRTVAVKLLSPAVARDTEFERRLEREGRALALLNHPHIVTIHELGREDDQSYLVMEYVEGRPLSELIPLPLERALDIVRQLCEALSYAHRHGVVHRDLKPQNVLIMEGDQVKVTDFGIARILALEVTGPAITRADLVLGTPPYMAPEARAGAPPDPRMDVYSLGLLLHEAVSGRLPAGDLSPLPGGLECVVRKALAPEPSHRYASADELARELAQVRPGSSVTLPSEERQWVRAVALLQALATGVALWAALLSLTPRVLPAEAVVPLAMLRTEPLADGRVVSWARFEAGPILASVGLAAAAIAGHGLLRRHWRLAGLLLHRPDRAVPESRPVLLAGVAAVLVFGLRLALVRAGQTWAATLAPIIGGLVEIAVLFLAWRAVLEAWRTARPLHRELRLWIGLGLALAPPVGQGVAHILTWTP